MKKIGIVTLNGYFNFGNRLQNYALQETLKKFDFQVDTLWIDNIRINSVSKSRTTKLMINPKQILAKIYKKIYQDPLKSKRVARFESFSKKYIKELDFKVTENNLPEKLLAQYDFFVTGSDQVWNPHYTKGSPLYYLTFAPKEKRIAYAPSFGVAEIPKEHSSDYQQWLSEIESLSVREEAGANIIKKMTGREAQVVADPTMLLTKEQWLQIAKPALNKPKEEFLLTYYLGQIPKETNQFINEQAEKYNLKIVNLANVKERKHYLVDPAEFLDYISTAKLFVTDSFHGAVFSILFETPFVVTDRISSTPSMNSRINTLLTKFKLEARHISKIQKNEVLSITYSDLKPILQKEREIAYDYLKEALHIK